MDARSKQATPAQLAELDMWVIYERPRDFPHGYVARLWRVATTARPTLVACIANTLEGVREMLPPGLTKIARHPTDEPQIVEVWLWCDRAQ